MTLYASDGGDGVFDDDNNSCNDDIGDADDRVNDSEDSFGRQ